MANSTEFISGRSRDRAKLLLELAIDAGYEPMVVRTDSLRGGYLVPKKVAAAYEKTLGQPDNAETPEATAETTTGEAGAETPAAGTDTEGAGTDNEGAAAEQSEAEAEDPQPAGNASQAVWADWAKRNKGYDESEGLTRDQLKERFGA